MNDDNDHKNVVKSEGNTPLVNMGRLTEEDRLRLAEEHYEENRITSSDEILDDLPIEHLFMYVTAKTRDLDEFATQYDLGTASLAKTLKQLGYYEESVPIKQIAFQLDGEIETLRGNFVGGLRDLMGLQALSLNAVFQYALKKFSEQQDEEGEQPNTRYLHYALMAQSLFMNTSKVIRSDIDDYIKDMKSFDPYVDKKSK